MASCRDRDLIREMRKTAGDYHLHFSTVRTASNSLIVPIGILASINLLDGCTAATRGLGMWLVVFVFGVALALNVTFAKWSRACRRIERYYERLLAAETMRYDPELHGFRHVFRTLLEDPTTACRLRRADENYPKPLRPTLRPGELVDTFVTVLVVGGVLYLILYWQMLERACTA